MKRKVGKRLSGEPVTLVPHEIIAVGTLPDCNFECGNKAEYDFATRMGPWANGCESHWVEYRASDRLGTGIGQMLIAESTVEEEVASS